MTDLARRRWKMLGEILLSKNLAKSSCHDEISVMRFKTYGLYIRSELKMNDGEDDGTWLLIEYPHLKDETSNIISIDIRLCSTKIDYADLIGFNNTGNTCIWPSEEVLAFYCLKYKSLFEKKSVCELGGGMTCLGGLSLARSIKLDELLATDGNEKSINNLNAIIRSKRNASSWLCQVQSHLLIWNRNFNDVTFKQRFDVILTADCFFFENLHDDLCHMISFMLKDTGLSINFAPHRSNSLMKFVSVAEKHSLECNIYENYDQDVFDKHLESQRINKNYSSDLHYPILVIIKKRPAMGNAFE